jgi:hypothetical protein
MKFIKKVGMVAEGSLDDELVEKLGLEISRYIESI